jgi:protein involved in polysaccharide export with SLBB domain/TolA-binding protein
MKKALLIGIFSLLALAPFRCALAQTGSNTPAVKAVGKSSAGVGSTTDERKIQDPASEAAARNATAKKQTTSPTLAESTEAISNVLPKAASEAQRNYNAGVALYHSGKLDEAISAFKEANKLKPNDPQTQYMLGMAYWKAKAYNDAVDSFKRAVRFKPDWAEAYFRLGLTYYVLGRKTQTNEAYKKLLELNSPLANKLYRINNDANPTNVAENEPTASTTKQVEVVPVSASAAVAPLNEKPRATGSESNNSSTTAASSNKAIPAVAPPNERPSTAVSESNNAPTTTISSAPATATATAPVTRTANGDPASSNKAIATDDSALTDIYKVGVGDVLDIRLLNSAANRSTLYSVLEGGLIDFPIAGGPIPVAGLTTKDIQARITSELKRLAVEERTQVAVGVRQYASHTVIITGLVSSPGTKILRREAVPLYVLLAEVQPRLDAALAAIMRAGAPTQVVDLSDSAALNFIVRPGDVINLTARPQEFYYIAGRISYPGQKTFQPGITLVQAILAAGGLARDHVVELSREGSDGRLATTKFNLKEIKSGKIQDPKLQPGDRIEVFH